MSFDLVPVGQKSPAVLPAQEVHGRPVKDTTLAERAEHGVRIYRGRPTFLNRSWFTCAKCNKIVDSEWHSIAEVAHYDPNAPNMTKEQMEQCCFPVFDCGAGYIEGRVTCHGESAGFLATFDQAWAAYDYNTKIVVFDSGIAIEDKKDIAELKSAAPRLK